MTTVAPDTSAPTVPRRRLGATLALLAFAQCIIAIDYNIVFVALPQIGEGLGFSSQTLQWVVSAYAVAFGGFLLLGGRAADLFGRRRMFVFGLFLYAASSLVGGLATEPVLLIGARAVQGIGGAFLAPATLSLVTTTFAEGAERNRALAVWGGAGGSGMVLGSLFGGVLTQAFGWEAVFYANVPLAGGAMLAAFALIPADVRTASNSGRRFDLFGALTVTAGATLLVFSLVQGPESGWTSPLILGSATAAVVLLLAFLLIEARSRDPLMPLRLFRNRSLSTGTVVTFLFMATFGALAYFYTVYFQNVHEFSALNTGLAFLLPCACVVVGTVLGGRMATRYGVRTTLFISLILGIVGTVAFGVMMDPQAGYLVIAPGLAVLSLGQGIVFTTMFAAATTGVAAENQGIASGIATTGQQVGGAVGLAVLLVLANARIDESATGAALRSSISDAMQYAVYLSAAGMLLTVLVVCNFRKSPAG